MPWIVFAWSWLFISAVTFELVLSSKGVMEFVVIIIIKLEFNNGFSDVRDVCCVTQFKSNDDELSTLLTLPDEWMTYKPFCRANAFFIKKI